MNKEMNMDKEQPNYYEDNKYIKMAVSELYRMKNEEALIQLLAVLAKRIHDEGQAPTPMVDVNHVLSSLTLEEILDNPTFTTPEEIRLNIDTMEDADGNQWLPLFTDEDELDKGQTTNIRINMPIREILEHGLSSTSEAGIVINPFGQSYTLPKELIKIVLAHLE